MARKDLILERARREMIRLCHAGLDSASLRSRLLKKLQGVIPYESVNCGTVDPATLLFTSVVTDGIPENARPAFLANELLEEDFNKIVHLAGSRCTVSTLVEATGGMPTESRRYREILTPLGSGNELRAVLRAGSTCWGAMCLHRDGPGFTSAEKNFLKQLARHLAEGLRMALLLGGATEVGSMGGDSPGLLVLSEDLTVVAATPAAECWLAELEDWSPGGGLPNVVRAVALRLVALERTAAITSELMPRARIRSRSGRWIVLHASRLAISGAVDQIAVILQLAQPMELSRLILQAYGLTPREAEVAKLVLRGLSTNRIAAELIISSLTVQQHLKAVFEKIGVSSRRQLAAQIYAEQYWPRVSTGAPLAPDGSFAVAPE